jgi:hypothetical protein
MKSKIIEKKIKFNDKDWLVKVNKKGVDHNEIEVLKHDDIHIWLPFDNNKFILSNMSLIKMCKLAVLQSNEILYSVNEYEELMKWDGDMDKELNTK